MRDRYFACVWRGLHGVVQQPPVTANPRLTRIGAVSSRGPVVANIRCSSSCRNDGRHHRTFNGSKTTPKETSAPLRRAVRPTSARLAGAALKCEDLEARRAKSAKVRRRDFKCRVAALRPRWIRVGAAGRLRPRIRCVRSLLDRDEKRRFFEEPGLRALQPLRRGSARGALRALETATIRTPRRRSRTSPRRTTTTRSFSWPTPGPSRSAWPTRVNDWT